MPIKTMGYKHGRLPGLQGLASGQFWPSHYHSRGMALGTLVSICGAWLGTCKGQPSQYRAHSPIVETIFAS